MWGYCEIGLFLLSKGKPKAQPLFCEWIDMYSSDEFRELSDWMRSMVDEAGVGASSDLRKRMHDAYRTSAGYEYAFWDMAWRLEANLK
jgi:thiaminase/transcriptional activator TenA